MAGSGMIFVISTLADGKGKKVVNLGMFYLVFRKTKLWLAE
jgi:hypothetical protein